MLTVLSSNDYDIIIDGIVVAIENNDNYIDESWTAYEALTIKTIHGDNTNMIVPVVCMVGAGAAIVYFMLKKRKSL